MISILWFKRDLRLDDHAALTAAAKRGPVLPLYIIEPDYWQQPDTSLRHWQFIKGALLELDKQLRSLGQPLMVLRGPASKVLVQLCQQYQATAVFSHEETGNLWSYQRDVAVAQALKAHGVAWFQFRQFAIFRPLLNRDHWFHQADDWLKSPLEKPPPALTPVFAAVVTPHAELPATRAHLEQKLTELAPTRQHDLPPCHSMQQAFAFKDTVHSFFANRANNYQKHISYAAKADQSCSRLSPYLSYGMLSMRALQQQCVQQMQQLQPGTRKVALQAFFSRLRWHCHFMQKLEDDPVIEMANMHPGFDGMRELDFSREKFAAFCAGQTGYPLIDAAIRCLLSTGWLHFRGRAMLVAFASYHLWLHWRPTALFLAQCFVDYEPGIHYPQIQMQSGTTSMNPNRIYNPLKQSQQKDPEGHFIRRWCPELALLPDSWLHSPWLLPAQLQRRYGVLLGIDYPMPIVQLEQAMREARAKLSAWSAQQDKTLWRAQQQQLVQRHASRKKPVKSTKAAITSAKTSTTPQQLQIFTEDSV